MTPENHHAAMNDKPSNSDEGIEMYPDSWQTIYEYGRNLAAWFGVFCAALFTCLLALRIFF